MIDPNLPTADPNAPAPADVSPPAPADAAAPAAAAPAAELALGTVVSHTYDDPRAESGTTTSHGLVVGIVHPVEKDSEGNETTLTHYVIGWFGHVSPSVPAELLDGS